MSRVKRGTKARARRKKVLKRAKGFVGGQSKLYRTAAERVRRAKAFATRDRKARKRDFRGLWIIRIGIAAKALGINYSNLMSGLKKAQVELNRKMLAEIAQTAPATFEKLVELAKSKLA